MNRAQLIDDSYKLAKIGYINYEIPLNLSKYINKENEYVPLLAYQQNVKDLQDLLRDKNEYELLKTFVSKQFERIIDKLGYEEDVNDNDSDKIVRSEIIKLLCSLDTKKCIENAKQSYKKWINHGVAISPNLEVPYLCAVIKSNGEEFDHLLNHLLNTKQRNLRMRLLNGLTCAQDNYALDRCISLFKLSFN